MLCIKTWMDNENCHFPPKKIFSVIIINCHFHCEAANHLANLIKINHMTVKKILGLSNTDNNNNIIDYLLID